MSTQDGSEYGQAFCFYRHIDLKLVGAELNTGRLS